MVVELFVENIAIIDRAVITLTPGFTALTGETGAGKSLLIDAIGLALGGRADSDLVRHGAAKAVIEMKANLADRPEVAMIASELGVPDSNREIHIRREVTADGRSMVKINGRAFAVGTLRDFGQHLVDLHSQHDHQSLLVQERQIEFLDSWIGETCLTRRFEVAEAYSELEAQKRKLSSIRSHRREREQRIDMLRYQIDEIESAGISVGEWDDLKNRLSRMQHAQRLGIVATAALSRLADDEGSAMEVLSQSVREIESVKNLDDDLVPLVDGIATAHATLAEAVQELRSYVSQLDLDPRDLEATAERLDQLQGLARKYGDDEETILRYLSAAKTELADLEDSGVSEEELIANIQGGEDRLAALADELTVIRRQGAERFTVEVTEQIRDLAMESAEFQVSVEKQAVQANGQDRVDFYFSANRGEPLRLLNRVASGGEISRVMLAIKVASAGRAGVPTLIFDEVDTGLSGRAAAITARKLEELARHYQVIVISHLPQIAGRANTHFRIEKREKQGRVTTTLELLEGEARISEIARMLGGESIGESALANARELVSGLTSIG